MKVTDPVPPSLDADEEEALFSNMEGNRPYSYDSETYITSEQYLESLGQSLSAHFTRVSATRKLQTEYGFLHAPYVYMDLYRAAYLPITDKTFDDTESKKRVKAWKSILAGPDHIDGWILGQPPGISSDQWPRWGVVPMTHAFTIRVPPDFRPHGEDRVALSFFYDNDEPNTEHCQYPEGYSPERAEEVLSGAELSDGENASTFWERLAAYANASHPFRFFETDGYGSILFSFVWHTEEQFKSARCAMPQCCEQAHEHSVVETANEAIASKIWSDKDSIGDKPYKLGFPLKMIGPYCQYWEWFNNWVEEWGEESGYASLHEYTSTNYPDGVVFELGGAPLTFQRSPDDMINFHGAPILQFSGDNLHHFGEFVLDLQNSKVVWDC